MCDITLDELVTLGPFPNPPFCVSQTKTPTARAHARTRQRLNTPPSMKVYDEVPSRISELGISHFIPASPAIKGQAEDV